MSEEVCGKSTECFSRISGYYRPTQNWNDGKAQEFKERKTYDQNTAIHGEAIGGVNQPTAKEEESFSGADEGTMDVNLEGLVLFTSKTCPNCKLAKEFMDKMGVDYKTLDSEENFDLIKALELYAAPTLVKFINGKAEIKVSTYPEIRKYIASIPVDTEEAQCESCHF